MTRWLLRLLVIAGLGLLAWKAWQLLREEDEDHSNEWAPAAPPASEGTKTEGTKTEGTATEGTATTWVKPVDATCPPGYPVKAKTASKVFRVPGMFSYEESKPDRCYCDEDAAVADGFTRAKR